MANQDGKSRGWLWFPLLILALLVWPLFVGLCIIYGGTQVAKKHSKPAAALLVIVGLVAGVGGEIVWVKYVGKNQDDVAVRSEPPQSTQVAVATTVTQPPLLSVSDLPIANAATIDPIAVKAAQNLLASFAIRVSADGKWGPRTEKGLLALRAQLGLQPGALDETLWHAVLTLPAPASFGKAVKSVEGLMVPESAVRLDSKVSGLGVTEAARYVMPFAADASAIANWILFVHPAVQRGSWRWCESDRVQPNVVRLFWWQRPDKMLDLVVTDLGVGRVEIQLAVEQGVELAGCQGAKRSTGDLQVAAPKYTWQDSAVNFDWLWRPVGTYTNVSDTTITSYQVIYRISTNGGLFQRTYLERGSQLIKPGGTVKIMPKLWFTLALGEVNQDQIGLALGSDVLFTSEVGYLTYADQSSAGCPAKAQVLC